LDASLVGSFKDIQKKLIWLRTYEEIKAHMEKPDEEVSRKRPVHPYEAQE